MKERWLAPSLFGAAAALLLFVGWRCPLRAALGVPCPGCGLTRATRLVLHGDVAGATAMHPLIWLVLPVVATFVSVEVVGYFRTGAWGASRRIPRGNVVIVGTAVLMFVLWLARFAGWFGGPVPS